jgi:hypothetical protein
LTCKLSEKALTPLPPIYWLERVKKMHNQKYMKEYRLKNKKQIKEKSRIYYLKHEKKFKKYYQENKEKIAINQKKWYQKNKEKIISTSRKWALKNPEKVMSIKKNWEQNNIEKVRSHGIKSIFRRKNWTSIPFNAFFEGAVGHHYDKFHIIWIPKELHKSVWHNLETGKNMTKINDLAFAWFEGLI